MEEKGENSEEISDTQEALRSFIFEYCPVSDCEVTITGDLSSFEKICPAEDFTLWKQGWAGSRYQIDIPKSAGGSWDVA